MADLSQQIEEVLTILHGPGSPESRVDRVTARLKAVQCEIEEQRAAVSRREPGSIIRIETDQNEITELRTACGHSFVTCHTDRCFRGPAPAQNAISRIALLFAAILTADGMLSQAAADVLPGRPGNVTYRRHIENWLREAS